MPKAIKIKGINNPETNIPTIHLPTLRMSKELMISRLYDAPQEEVFQAFTSAESLKQWWGPAGFELEVKSFDFRQEGMFHFVLKGPGNSEMWAKWMIKSIEIPHKLSFINCFSNEKGEVEKAPVIPFGKDWPEEMLVDLEFFQLANQTRIDLVSIPHNANEAAEKVFSENISNMEQGFKGTFDQLEAYLKR